MLESPIFIIGSERSGSNLLRLALNSHPHIAIPHPPHVMKDMFFLSNYYGDLSKDGNFHSLIQDSIMLVNNHFSPWPFFPSFDQICTQAPSRSLYGIYSSLYEQYCQFQAKVRWGCKSTFMYRHIDEILQHHKSPKFIHLVRDPRDVAASASQSIFSKFHPGKTAQLWVEEQTTIEKWSHLSEQNILLRVRYEDLTQAPEQTLREIMGFLNELYYPEQLNYYQLEETIKLANLSVSWKKLQRPISNKNIGRYKSSLKAGDIEYIESIAYQLMQKYGYVTGTDHARFKLTQFYKVKIEIIELALKVKNEIASAVTDKNFLLRWRKSFFLKFLVLKRYFVNRKK